MLAQRLWVVVRTLPPRRRRTIALAATATLAAITAIVLLLPPHPGKGTASFRPDPRPGLPHPGKGTAACTRVPVFKEGREVGTICAEEAGSELTVVGLGDDWLPVVFSETSERPQRIRKRLLDLANERLRGAAFERARRDRHFELYGIFPSMSVIGRRLLDERRHQCHDQVADQTLTAEEKRPSAASVAAVNDHLRCEGLLPPKQSNSARSARQRNEGLGGASRRALGVYRRRHMAPGPARLDAELRTLLASDSRELDFRALLRALRERVADSAGLLEDGSAAGRAGTVLGRTLEGREIVQTLASAGATPVRGEAAADLLSPATEAAARALGWTSPQSARDWFQSRRDHQRSAGVTGAVVRFRVPPRAALPLPRPPDYHRPQMDLRVQIDRGDVWLALPGAAGSRRRPATMTIYARDGQREVALARWPTTIGGWQPFEEENGSMSLRYGESPVGSALWRDLLAAPTWYPPAGIPVRSLLEETPEGPRPRTEVISPGYRAAYGLMALVHEERRRSAATDGAGEERLVDKGIRTHGSPAFRSIGRGYSHGCHRLYNHLVLRLGSFLLRHREHVRHGAPRQRYQRTLAWQQQEVALQSDHRGYRYELVPPIPVEVLPGRVRGSRAAVARAIPIAPGPGGQQLATAEPPED